MDLKEQRSRSPSLLDADAGEPASALQQGRILSGLQGNAEPSSTPVRSRRWLWPLLLLVVGGAAVLLLVLGGAFDGAGSPPGSRVATVAASPSVPETDASPGKAMVADVTPGGAQHPTSDIEGYTSPDAAVILTEHSDAGISVGASPPAPAASVSKDAEALSEMFAPAAERKRPVPSRRAAPMLKESGDSDVALLTALLRHVEVGSPASRKALGQIGRISKPLDPIEVRMQACPPANTEDGLKCRQKLCAGHSGQAAACPASSPDGA